jgi:hypothetical protein
LLLLGILEALAELVPGAQAVVTGAVTVARTLGTSERVVGLTGVSAAWLA